MYIFFVRGPLALMRSTSTEPQPLLADVQDADWSPSGDELAITHYVDDLCQLEFPVGRVVRCWRKPTVVHRLVS